MCLYVGGWGGGGGGGGYINKIEPAGISNNISSYLRVLSKTTRENYDFKKRKKDFRISLIIQQKKIIFQDISKTAKENKSLRYL